MSLKPEPREPESPRPRRRILRRGLSLLLLAAGAAVTLSGCVAYPYDQAPAYGYGGPVVAPSVVVAPAYRPYGYYGGRGGWYGGWGGGWSGRRW